MFCDGKSNEQLEAALLDARIKQYRSSSRACMHIGAICTGGQMLHLQWNNNAHSHWPLLVSMSAWLMHLLISSNIVQLNRVRSKLFVLATAPLHGTFHFSARKIIAAMQRSYTCELLNLTAILSICIFEAWA